MSEQQRVLTTVVLCFGIWFGWQVFFGEPPSTPTDSAFEATAPGATSPAADASRDAATSDDNAAHRELAGQIGRALSSAAAPSEPLPYASRTLSTPKYFARLRNNDAAFENLVLTSFARFDQPNLGSNADAEPAGESMVSARHGRQAQLSVRFGETVVPLAFAADSTHAQQAGEAVRLLGAHAFGDAHAQVSLTITPRPEAYAWDYQVRVENHSSTPLPADVQVLLQMTPPPEDKSAGRTGLLPIGGGERIDMPSAVYSLHDKIVRQKADTKPNHKRVVLPAVQWAGIETQYFLMALVGPAEQGLPIRVLNLPDAGMAIEASTLGAPIEARGDVTASFTLFAGPKRDGDLVSADPRLASVIDYNILGIPMGFLARPAMWLLRAFYDLTRSWGVAIMLLTVVVKVLLLPASIYSAMKMRRLQLLKPQLEVLQKRFKDDPQRLSTETFALYKKHNANPLAGCLPMLLQLPVWFAFYRALASAVDLYRQPFLWISDLHLKEPFPFLALAVGGLTLLQQRLTPMAGDTQQARVMMWMMPVLVPAMMVSLPAGLVLYIVINSTLTIFQQLAINRLAA